MAFYSPPRQRAKSSRFRAATGEEIWKFDPFAGEHLEASVNRGVVYWEGHVQGGADRRILFTAGSRLYALDAATGAPKSEFGNGGWIDLAMD